MAAVRETEKAGEDAGGFSFHITGKHGLRQPTDERDVGLIVVAMV